MLRRPQSRAWHVTRLRRAWSESVKTRAPWFSPRYVREMGRPDRYLAAGAYYHVGIRGNNHARIVLDDGDRIVFFHILRRIERRYGWRTHVRCLMGNHYHLLVETPLPNLADGMRDLNGAYARAFNERHSRKDHVFGRRYWSKLIESDEQYAATVDYIVNNPLHHGFVRRLDQWRWTSGPAVSPVDSPRVS
jgi:REP-associated tyrosine transposase